MSQQLDEAKGKIQQVWQEMAPAWETHRDFLADATRALSEWMLSKLDPQPGQVILDLAAGTGDLGFMAAKRLGPSGKILTTDFAPEMVEVARRAARELGIENAEFRQLDAERNDLPADSVDGVLCRWGFMLMPDPQAALRQTRRVLRPGGRLVFSVMSGPPDNPWGSVPFKALVDLSLAPAGDPATPGGLFSLSDEELVRRMVGDAGFEALELEKVDFHFRFADFDAYWRFLTEFAGAISAFITNLDLPDQQAARDRIKSMVEPFRSGEGYDFPGRTLSGVAL